MNGQSDRAVLAGGCFWGMQDLLRRYPGIVSTRVGYTGGDVPNATFAASVRDSTTRRVATNSSSVGRRQR